MTLDELDALVSDARFRKAFESKRDFLAFLLEVMALIK